MGSELRDKVVSEVGKVVVGREREAELVLTCLLARGHVLLEGVPGVSKTLVANAFSRCLGLQFRRVQFTPDILPLDIIGGYIFNLKDREFEFRRGPVFTNILLADEINRAPPKVQSALLESMQESQVTVEGHTERLPSPFMVIATQNPMEFEGVYPLPENQLDRFMVKVNFGYPSRELEAGILRRNLSSMDVGELRAVATPGELESAMREVETVTVSDDILTYLARLAEATRSEASLVLGASPRAMVQLLHCARARALLDRRKYVTPQDIKAIANLVLAHRLAVDRAAALKGVSRNPEVILTAILDRVEPPR
ncbi:MAG: MoxR family ATPase [Nitrososphaerota archaeon]|nr:MoxR family ATPase [Nitrososphaerota archaeon]MDG7022153.1 MoxR family ATPase [Nitrososphaerota archaeon]